MVVNGYGEDLLGPILADDILIQIFADFLGLGKVGTNGGYLYLQFFTYDVIAKIDAFIADEYGRTGYQLAYLMLTFASKRAIEQFAAVLGLVASTVSHYRSSTTYICTHIRLFAV
jgi:hypothetical protein